MKKNLPTILFFTALLILTTACSSFTVAPKNERTVQIGILLRKQFTKDLTDTERRYRHIQVLLADQGIVGYNKMPQDISFFRYAFTKTPGQVRDLEILKNLPERRHYIDAFYAQDAEYHGESGYKMVTDWIKFNVTPQQASALEKSWLELQQDTPKFRLFGLNCASRAAEMFVKAGILPHGLPGLDTPEAVYERIKEYYPDATCETGYFGYDTSDRPFLIPLTIPAK